jgi:adenine-specific DNA-methyltransferase
MDSAGNFAKVHYENKQTTDELMSQLEPRLELARQLLSENGSIFCSIDDTNQAYLKLLFDKVFGRNNFIKTLI